MSSHLLSTQEICIRAPVLADNLNYSRLASDLQNKDGNGSILDVTKIWQGKMKWVTWQVLSSLAESYARGLAFYITIAEGMKEPHSESVMPLWLQPGARASLKTVSCANLSGALWGRWKGATEKTIGSTWLGLGVCPQTHVVRGGHQLTHFASDWVALEGQVIDLAPKVWNVPPAISPGLWRLCSQPHTFTGLFLVATGLTR